MRSVDLLWAFGIPVIQLSMCRWRNRSIGFLTVFLLVESIAELALASINAWGSDEAFLYAWCIGAALHHAMCGFLLSNIYGVVRKRGLPGRQSVLPICALTGFAGGVGFAFAKYSLGLIIAPSLRMVFPLDHAVSFAIGCMLAIVPFYCFAISSSIPRPVYLVLIGFGIYETAYAGLLGLFITRRHLDFPHAIDVVFLISLYVWSVALRSKNPSEVAELLPITP